MVQALAHRRAQQLGALGGLDGLPQLGGRVGTTASEAEVLHACEEGDLGGVHLGGDLGGDRRERPHQGLGLLGPQLDAQPAEDLLPRRTDVVAAGVDTQAVKGAPTSDWVLEIGDLGRDGHLCNQQLGGEHGRALKQQGGSEFPRLQILSRQVLHQLPDPPLLLRERPGAHDGGHRLEVRVVGVVHSSPAHGPQPSLPGHHPHALVGELLDEDGLEHADRGDRADQLDEVGGRHRLPRPPPLHLGEGSTRTRRGQ